MGKKEIDPCGKFYEMVFGKQDQPIKHPDDFSSSVSYVIREYLYMEDAKIICYRCGFYDDKCYSCAGISKLIRDGYYTPQQISHISQKAIKHIRNTPECVEILTIGLKKFREREQIRKVLKREREEYLKKTREKKLRGTLKEFLENLSILEIGFEPVIYNKLYDIGALNAYLLIEKAEYIENSDKFFDDEIVYIKKKVLGFLQYYGIMKGVQYPFMFTKKNLETIRSQYNDPLNKYIDEWTLKYVLGWC